MEQHEDNRGEFKKLMPILRTLDEEETEIFFHLVNSKDRVQNAATQRTNDLIDMACSDELKTKLATLSEEANFALKNTWQHQNTTMKYADKKRMPVDHTKVRDILRNQHLASYKLDADIGTYTEFQHNNQFESGVLTYLNEVAWGDLRDLLNDIGINRETLKFYNTSDMVKSNDQRVLDSDKLVRDNLMNARFTSVDMTDYEQDFTGFNEIKGAMPIHSLSTMSDLLPEQWPQTNAMIEVTSMEKMDTLQATSKSGRELQ